MTTEAVTAERSVDVSPALQHEVEQFLYHEARLLDARRYRDWLALLADDLQYVLPVRMNRTAREAHLEVAPVDDIAHFADDRQTIEWKVTRTETGFAWTEDPPSRTRHIVTNVWIRPTEEPDAYDVDSNFLVYRNREEDTVDMWVGVRLDHLRRRGPGDWQIARRTIMLDQGILLTGNLSTFF